MKRSMTSRWGHAAWLGLLAAACTGQEVTVGRELGQGLDRCVGTTDGCKAVQAKEPAAAKPGHCPDEDEAEQALMPEFTFKWSERLCPRPAGDCGKTPEGEVKLCALDPASLCSATLKAAKPAPDGSIWIAATVSTGVTVNQALWLGHVGSDGSDLGFRKVASGTALRGNSVYYSADLAIDAESHAYLVASGNDPGPDADSEIRDHTWLQQYDAEGNSVDGAWDLPGLARSMIALSASGRIALAADAVNLDDRAIAAVLESSSDLVWSQPKVPSTGARQLGLMGVGADADGNVYVYTHRGDRKQRTLGSFGVVKFDANGKRVWDRLIPGGFKGAIVYESSFGVDAEGNATAAGGVPDGSDGPISFDAPAHVISLDPRGETRWVLDVAGVSTRLHVAHATGHVYLTGGKSTVRIAPDGTCRRLALPADWEARGDVEQGPDDRLYFVGGYTLGRYKTLLVDD